MTLMFWPFERQAEIRLVAEAGSRNSDIPPRYVTCESYQRLHSRVMRTAFTS
jgi:hypothetical protein